MFAGFSFTQLFNSLFSKYIQRLNFPWSFRVFCFVLFQLNQANTLFIPLALEKYIFKCFISISYNRFSDADADEYYMQLIKMTIQREIFGKDWKQLFHFVYSSFDLVSVYVILEDNIRTFVFSSRLFYTKNCVTFPLSIHFHQKQRCKNSMFVKFIDSISFLH